MDELGEQVGSDFDTPLGTLVGEIAGLGQNGPELAIDDTRLLISKSTSMTRPGLLGAGWDQRTITRLTTKLRDSGRRSAPWRPTSSRVPGRPQDGADGNRISRWLLPVDHKFYADEIIATLVEVKYHLQILSMEGATALPGAARLESFRWLIEHTVSPGYYLDPIQLIPISLSEVKLDLRSIQSGHIVPLDRGGRHVP